ncbi:unnamed protein product, partial [Symbiodinium pilosum]
QFDAPPLCRDSRNSGDEWLLPSKMLAGMGVDATVFIWIFFAITFVLLAAALLLCHFCCPHSRRGENQVSTKKPQAAHAAEPEV